MKYRIVNSWVPVPNITHWMDGVSSTVVEADTPQEAVIKACGNLRDVVLEPDMSAADGSLVGHGLGSDDLVTGLYIILIQ